MAESLAGAEFQAFLSLLPNKSNMLLHSKCRGILYGVSNGTLFVPVVNLKIGGKIQPIHP
jgi:hypothetical protein